MNLLSGKEFCQFGEIYTIKNIRVLLKKSKQIHYSNDLEHLHKSRVSTRKLRAALDNFKDCYPPELYQVWLKELKAVTKVLGKSRDLDVQIDFLKKFMNQIANAQHREGIKRFILRLNQRRKKQQPKITRSLEMLNKGKFFGHYKRKTGTTNGIDFRSRAVFDKIYELVNLRINETLKYSNDIYDPAKKVELHEMRKKNKQLRYTLEIFAPLFDQKLDHSIAKITELHDLLGIIHDSDVWIEFIPVFSADEKRRTQKFFGNTVQFRMIKPGLDYLLKDRKKARDNYYTAFIESWNSLITEDFWGKLPKIILEEKL